MASAGTKERVQRGGGDATGGMARRPATQPGLGAGRTCSSGTRARRRGGCPEAAFGVASVRAGRGREPEPTGALARRPRAIGCPRNVISRRVVPRSNTGGGGRRPPERRARGRVLSEGPGGTGDVDAVELNGGEAARRAYNPGARWLKSPAPPPHNAGKGLRRLRKTARPTAREAGDFVGGLRS